MNIFSNLVETFAEIHNISKDLFYLNLKFLFLNIKILIPMILITMFFIFITFLCIKLMLKFVPHGDPEKLHVAFSHPYCNAGGGGERVLWTSIQAIQLQYPNVECYIYTGDTDSTPTDIMDNVYRRFSIQLERQPHFIYLHFRKLVEAKYYPFFTLLMQSLGSVFLAIEALSKFRPSVFIDTTGYAFAYPIFRFFGGCDVASYTHYPTISSDMLVQVSSRTEAHNNRGVISRSWPLSMAKLAYYHMFAFAYGLVGSCAQVIMVNSSWTRDHITSLWHWAPSVVTVYPPCDTRKFCSLAIIPDDEKNIKSIVSIGQFRPEKDFPLQLRAFAEFVHLVDADTNANSDKLQLVLIGGVRNEEDKSRVEEYKLLARELGVETRVVWKVNATFTDLLIEVQRGTIGLHTMWNEHFGIGVVECMAGGLIMVAHDSGGPKRDIVTPYYGRSTGFLADSVESYARRMKDILDLPEECKTDIREAARSSTERFSEQVFKDAFLDCMKPILDPRRTE